MFKKYLVYQTSPTARFIVEIQQNKYATFYYEHLRPDDDYWYRTPMPTLDWDEWCALCCWFGTFLEGKAQQLIDPVNYSKMTPEELDENI